MARLSPELIRLLENVLDGLEKVDISWHVATAERPLSLTELQARTYLDTQTLRTAISELAADGILLDGQNDPDAPVALGARAKSPDFETLMKHYTEDRVLVVNTATRIAMERIRNMAASTFADAFLIRPRKKRDDDV
jgi:hypothetical protein